MVVALLLCMIMFVWAHPLLNLNAEDRTVYENLEASENSLRTSLSIRPYSLSKVFLFTERKERIREYVNALSSPGFFIKPVNSITVGTFYTSEEEFFIENFAGTRLRRGFNLYSFLDGYASFGKRFVVYYQVRYRQDKAIKKANLHRAYAKLKVWRFSFEAGKDTVHLGPGEYSLLLSSHAEPFPMIKVQTEEPLRFIGKWDLLFLRGWFKEDREDRNDPNILALRIVWKPWDFLEIGGTRTAMYGGEGRPGYKLTEYPKLIAGTEENIPYGKYDADGYGAYDITLYLPVGRLVRSIKVFKVYYQEAGTDIVAWWQKEDEGKFKPPLGFTFLGRGYIAGVFLSTDKDIFRLEFNRTAGNWYVHHLYPVDGYTYKGLSLGHPYGRDVVHLFFNHRRYLSDKLSIRYRLGFIQQPLEGSGLKMKRYYVTLSGEKRMGFLIISAFLRGDRTDNYDADPSPTGLNIVNKDKTFFTGGFTVSWRF